MGLKTTNYQVKNTGICLPEAYAQISHLAVSEDGTCYANFKIQQSRDVMNLSALDNVNIVCNVDKSMPIFSQVYIYAKENTFAGWEDDIVDSKSEVINNG